MTSSNAINPPEDGTPNLNGMRILLVEDSWHLGTALKSLLQAWGAEVVGPVATVIAAEASMAERRPDVALVDFNLRGGERADRLINRLHDQAVCVIVTSGYAALPVAAEKVMAVLQKPIDEAELIKSLRPLARAKADR